MPATRAAAAAATAVSTERASKAPAAQVPADGRQPEASSGRREVAGTASGQLTLAATPADPTAAAPMTVDTVTEGRPGVVAAVGSTTATGESLTAATAAAAAEAEDTAAGSKSG